MALDKKIIGVKRKLEISLHKDYKKTKSLSASSTVKISQELDKVILKLMYT